jgi:hypothetical protein
LIKGLMRRTANVADLGLQALYELSAPSTPPEVREEIERRIAAGVSAACGTRVPLKRS